MAHEQTLEIYRALGRVVVTPRGALAGNSAAVLDRILTDLIEGQGNLEIVIDALHVSHVDDEAARVIAHAATLMARHNGDLVVSSAAPSIRRRLQDTGVALAPVS